MLTEKDYCDYETCVALWKMGLIPHPYDNTDTDKVMAIISLYEAQKWLREEKWIQIEVPICLTDDGVWKFSFRLQTRKFYDRAIGEWDTYEEALSEGIKEAIKCLKENE